MAVKIRKPLENSSRGTSYLDFSMLTKTKVKSLLQINKKSAGRNNTGRITVAHHGGGSKRFLRLVNFDFRDMGKAKILGLEYDPNRTANIALIQYENGDMDYILAPVGVKVGGTVESGEHAGIRPGNRMPLKNIPAGTQIHNIAMKPEGKGILCRSAASYATLSGFESKYAILRMPSSETRKVLKECLASIGQVGNTDSMNVKVGKAGRSRWKGIRPTVRGKAKNVCDHPHGGGEGGTSIGMPHPKTPWGMPALGYRTRNKKKPSGSLILKRRK